MKLNHLSLSVPDVGATATFMQQYFQFGLLEMKTDKIAVLSGHDNFILVLTTTRPEDNPYPVDFHFGCILDDANQVTAVYEKMMADGHALQRPPARIRNSFGFYFHIPGGVMAEISCTL